MIELIASITNSANAKISVLDNKHIVCNILGMKWFFLNLYS